MASELFKNFDLGKTDRFIIKDFFCYSLVSGLKCYVSRGYQSLEELNKNKDNPEHSRQCNSTYGRFSSCFSYTGNSNVSAQYNFLVL
jgi:hypothetical protein